MNAILYNVVQWGMRGSCLNREANSDQHREKNDELRGNIEMWRTTKNQKGSIKAHTITSWVIHIKHHICSILIRRPSLPISVLREGNVTKGAVELHERWAALNDAIAQVNARK